MGKTRIPEKSSLQAQGLQAFPEKGNLPLFPFRKRVGRGCNSHGMGAPGFPGGRKIPARGTELIPWMGLLRDEQGMKELGAGRRIPPQSFPNSKGIPALQLPRRRGWSREMKISPQKNTRRENFQEAKEEIEVEAVRELRECGGRAFHGKSESHPMEIWE